MVGYPAFFRGNSRLMALIGAFVARLRVSPDAPRILNTHRFSRYKLANMVIIPL